MKKLPIILDVDTGIDDAMTLMMACAEPTVEILGVNAVFGNTSLANTLRNTLNVLKLCGREDIPVSEGAERPLIRQRVAAEHVHGKDGLGGYRFPFEDATKALTGIKAWDATAQLISQSHEKVVLCQLGPLTNAAILLQKYPRIKEKIEAIVFMGGCIRGGNLSPQSSVNVFLDPHAAKIVMESGVDFYMVAEVTWNAYITPDEIKKMTALRSPVGKANAYFLQEYYRVCEKIGQCAKGQCLHDPATFLFLTNPELFTYNRYFCQVETASEMAMALTVIDYENILQMPEGMKHLFYVDGIDREKAISIYMQRIRSYEKGGPHEKASTDH